jgi:hypothetical protein
MKTLMAVIALGVSAAMVAPAIAAPERKTEMVDEGKPVDSLLMRYAFDATWVLDEERILIRDEYRDHYLVTLKERCEWIDLPRPFKFVPRLHDRVRASLSYDVRDNQHEDCSIAKIEKVPMETAKGLRAELAAKE